MKKLITILAFISLSLMGYAQSLDSVTLGSSNFMFIPATGQLKVGSLDTTFLNNPVIVFAGDTLDSLSSGVFNNTHTDAQRNVMTGIYVGEGITTGTDNTYSGYMAGGATKTGIGNTIMGAYAGQLLSNVGDNAFFGMSAGYSTISGYGNTFIGSQTGYSNTSNYNTFIGHQAGYASTSADNNCMIGFYTGVANVTGKYNTYVGSSCAQLNGGSNNTYLGYLSGTNATNSSGSIFIGNKSGYYTLLSNRLVIHNGLGCTNAATDTTNSIIVGNMASTVVDQQLKVNADLEIPAAQAFYFGDETTDGSWRITRSGNNLIFERRESGNWVPKQTIAP